MCLASAQSMIIADLVLLPLALWEVVVANHSLHGIHLVMGKRVLHTMPNRNIP